METSQQVWNWINLLFGGVGIAIGMALFQFIYNRVGRSVKITCPESKSVVPHEVECRGIRSWLSRWGNQELWVVVRPLRASKYYPQGNMPAPGDKGEWRSLAYAGSSPDSELGDSFDVYAVTANYEGSAAIRDYLFESKLKNNWEGLSKLPNGCSIKASIEVVHQK